MKHKKQQKSSEQTQVPENNLNEDPHYNQGQLLDPRFNVFNRKKMRKEKRQHKKSNIGPQGAQQQITSEIPNITKKPIQKIKPVVKVDSKQKQLQRLISDDQREIDKLQSKLKLKNNRPTKKMMELDGLDEELFDFLDHIGTISKKDKNDEYKGFDNKKGNFFAKGKEVKYNQAEEFEDEDEESEQFDEEYQDENEEENEEEFEDDNEDQDQDYMEEEDDYDQYNEKQQKYDNEDDEEVDEEEQRHINQDKAYLEEKRLKFSKTKKEVQKPKVPVIVEKQTSSRVQQDVVDLEIEKQLKRNLNKIAEPNLDSIMIEIFKIFEANPKQLVTQILGQIFRTSTLEPMNMLYHQISCNTIVTCVVHQMYDNISFAELVRVVVTKYKDVISVSQQNKHVLKNITLVICHWFIFESIGIDFVKEYILDLLKHLSSSTLECLLTVIQSCGRRIRQDSPGSLKIILDETKIAIDANVKNLDQDQQSKINFLQMNLNDLRTNKKMNNDPAERLIFFTTWFKRQIIVKQNLTRKIFPQGFENCLNSDFQHLNWWIPLAQQNKQKEIFDDYISKKANISNEKNQQLELLAVEQKMMTEVRKAIFKIIMGADDLYEASQNLLRMQLVKKQKFEIAVVLLELCGNENIYNPYYGSLAIHLFSLERGMRQQFQYALWDKLKLLKSYNLRKISNLAKFTAQMILKNILSLQTLKWFQWDKLSEEQILFNQLVFWNFLLKANEKIIIQQTTIVDTSDSQGLREGITQFLRGDFKAYVLKQTMDQERETLLIKSTKQLLLNLQVQK